MFANLAEARKALESTQNVKIGKKLIRVQFAAMKAKAETEKGMWDCLCHIIHVGVPCHLIFDRKIISSVSKVSLSHDHVFSPL